MSAGRPTKYKPEYCQLLIDHMAKGYSYESFGAQVDCSKQTVYDWEKHPAFLDAKRLAFTKCQEFWEKQAMLGLWSSPDGDKLNSTVWIFNMKNRFGWSDKKEIKQETKQIPVEIADYENPIQSDDETD